MILYYRLDYCIALHHLKHFKAAHQTVIVSKVVAGDDETLARFAPDVTEAVVAEVGHPGPRTEVDTAVGSLPALGTETETWTVRDQSELQCGPGRRGVSPALQWP